MNKLEERGLIDLNNKYVVNDYIDFLVNLEAESLTSSENVSGVFYLKSIINLCKKWLSGLEEQCLSFTVVDDCYNKGSHYCFTNGNGVILYDHWRDQLLLWLFESWMAGDKKELFDIRNTYSIIPFINIIRHSTLFESFRWKYFKIGRKDLEQFRRYLARVIVYNFYRIDISSSLYGSTKMIYNNDLCIFVIQLEHSLIAKYINKNELFWMRVYSLINSLFVRRDYFKFNLWMEKLINSYKEKYGVDFIEKSVKKNVPVELMDGVVKVCTKMLLWRDKTIDTIKSYELVKSTGLIDVEVVDSLDCRYAKMLARLMSLK